MNSKRILKLVAAILCAAGVFIIINILSITIFKNMMGDAVYAAKMPLLIPLQAIAALISLSIFTVKSNYEDDSEDIEEEDVSEETDFHSQSVELISADMSEYPEFDKRAMTTSEESTTVRPDIRSFIAEQKCSPEENNNTEEADSEDELLKSFINYSKDIRSTDSVYDNIPTELPEGYTPYEEDEDENNEEVEEYEEAYEGRINPIFLRIAAAVISAIIAVFLPINTATIYCPEKIIVRSPFASKEYSIAETQEYTVSVKLSGDISVKIKLADGKTKELIASSYTVKSDSFNSEFSSTYSYAAHCDRLLGKGNVTKHISDISSYIPSPALSDEDIAFIEEIIEQSIQKEQY